MMIRRSLKFFLYFVKNAEICDCCVPLYEYASMRAITVVTATRRTHGEQGRRLNHAQFALLLCFRNFRLQSCAVKQTTV